MTKYTVRRTCFDELCKRELSPYNRFAISYVIYEGECVRNSFIKITRPVEVNLGRWLKNFLLFHHTIHPTKVKKKSSLHLFVL